MCRNTTHMASPPLPLLQAVSFATPPGKPRLTARHSQRFSQRQAYRYVQEQAPHGSSTSLFCRPSASSQPRASPASPLDTPRDIPSGRHNVMPRYKLITAITSRRQSASPQPRASPVSRQSRRCYSRRSVPSACCATRESTRRRTSGATASRKGRRTRALFNHIHRCTKTRLHKYTTTRLCFYITIIPYYHTNILIYYYTTTPRCVTQ